MSDLVVVLRERIRAVRRGVPLGTDRIRNAQEAIGLSNEKIARELYISEKTWRRWRDIGEIPREHLPAVAKVLRLEIEDPTAPSGELLIEARLGTIEGQIAGIERRQVELVDTLDDVLRTLNRLADGRLRVEVEPARPDR